MVKIGHAESDEEKKSRGGQPGDQTGKEVYIRDWYLRSKGWQYVIRPLKAEWAEAIASCMEQACNNDKVGYNQDKRETLYEKAKKKNWKVADIKTKCDTDCSALVAVCCNAAGINVPASMYTGNEAEILKKTKCFALLTDKMYTTNHQYLKRGDILLGPGHTAVVLTDGIAPNNDIESNEDDVCINLRVLKKGDKGNDVRALQILLEGNGLNPNGIDGDFGKGCFNAVMEFQKNKGLEADGIVGIKTWVALLK